MLSDLNEDGERYYDKAFDMLKRNRAAFAKDPKNPSRTHLMEVDIDTGDAPPQADRPRRYGDVDRKIIEENTELMLKRGHIEPSVSQWVSNIV